MSSRRQLLSVLRNVRLAPAGRPAAAPSTRSFHLPAAGAASTSGSNDGSFSYIWNRQLVSTFGAILIGQAAVFLGLSNNSVLAQDDSVALTATRSEQADANVTSLCRIEDGSVISNVHTIKWRIFTDNAREFFLKGKLDEAEKFFKAALHEAKEGFGLKDPHVASALNNLAEFYSLRREYQKAEQLYLEAIEILEESFGPDDIRVGTALLNLGQHYHVHHRFDQAQTCYERALKIEGRVLGLGHPDYANTMYHLAKVLSRQRKGKDAEALIRESIRILEELVKSKRLAEAENLQRKILHNLELLKGWDSLDTTMAAEMLSVTLETMGKLKEAEELLERCLAVKKKILSEDHFKVAGALVRLARLALLKFSSDLKVNNDLARSHLVKAKQFVNDSIRKARNTKKNDKSGPVQIHKICASDDTLYDSLLVLNDFRITEGILNSSRKDQKKLNSKSRMDRDQIAATAVLLQALEVVGLLEVARKEMLTPGLVLLLRLPLEHMKHGYFKIDAVHISDTCRLFIWPDKHLIDVRYTTLRIHFKNKFEKDQFDYLHVEQALHKCISLYNEPHTRSIVSKAVRQDYMKCLSRLVGIVRHDPVLNTTKMQDLLGEIQLIMKELGAENNRK